MKIIRKGFLGGCSEVYRVRAPFRVERIDGRLWHVFALQGSRYSFVSWMMF